ncbi:hypothetical protein [Rhodanobacter sp. DHG33]|uniref:hypothetical protein n=1 Tax=Rhodanobacter sp. DHG33 TaxID=2775921 RepID=UPI001781122C|nr:hypothetical protein [Rhodanobacter sp. DHG33]MBD8899990.1 hypothetical protein [Rhodanobacter sp. DHG33]
MPNISIYFEMTRVSSNAWEGHFYRDALQNAAYFGLGVCHWDVIQASPAFSKHGENFVPSSGLGSDTPYIEYFKKSDFLNKSQKDGGYGTASNDPELAKHPDAFFLVTTTVKEVTP